MNFAAVSNPLGDEINRLIDAALEKDSRDQPRRTYLGASRIGVACTRRLGYEYHGTEGEGFSGALIRRFRLGHIHELETIAWLHRVGFDLRTETEAGAQFGFELAPHPVFGYPRFAGHVDGIIMTGPSLPSLDYPCVFEHKIMKSSAWRTLVQEGARAKFPEYWAQAQVYMRQFGLASTLFVALNSNTSALQFEVIPFDSAEADRLIDRAAWIIGTSAPEELPRIASQETDWHCKFCPFRRTCWKSDAPIVNMPVPLWLRNRPS